MDVGEGAVEDPEVAVDAPRVEHLDDELDVVAVEEPEVAGVAGQGDRLAVPLLPWSGTAQSTVSWKRDWLRQSVAAVPVQDVVVRPSSSVGFG